MKIRTSPSTVQVQGPVIGRGNPNHPSNRPDCFRQIWRDCSSGTVYYVFTDGSIYAYNLPTDVDNAREVIAAANHGWRFNLGVRRGAFYASSFTRLTSIPGGAALIYSNPPYAGTDPGPCPTGDWKWTLTSDTGPWSPTSWSPGNGATSNTVTSDNNPIALPGTGNWQIVSLRTPTAGAAMLNVNGSFSAPAGTAFLNAFGIELDNPVLPTQVIDFTTLSPGTFDYNFPLDTTGPTDSIQLFVFWNQNGPTGNPGTVNVTFTIS